MGGVGDQVAADAWILTEATEDGPVARAGPDGDTTGLGQKGVDELEGVRRGGRRVEDFGVSGYPHETVQYEFREGEGFGAGAKRGEPVGVSLMLDGLGPMGVDQNIDIGHLHGCYRVA